MASRRTSLRRAPLAPAVATAAGPGLAASSEDAPQPKRGFWQRLRAEIGFILALAAAVTLLMTAVIGRFYIPSESMQPTLEVGDHIYVSKFAYGWSRYSLPFGLSALPLPEGRLMGRLPRRGDVVVFRNPNNGTTMIKRLAGLPGDRLQMSGGRLLINGTEIQRVPRGERLYRTGDRARMVRRVTAYDEQLPGEAEAHQIWEMFDDAPLDNTDVFEVPQGHVFFLGDHRENSADSRVGTQDLNGEPLPSAALYGPGFVPLDHLIGRADLILFSFNRCDREEGLRCPDRGRALTPL